MEEIEYGRIVVLMKDGSEGSSFSVTSDVLFGRDKDADIRIKLTSVSRKHALLSIDQNGRCQINHLSKTNPTRVNDMEISNAADLHNGDVICIGERKFIFECGNDFRQDTTETKGVLKQVPVLETIDESITLDFSKKGNSRSNSTPARKITPKTCPSSDYSGVVSKASTLPAKLKPVVEEANKIDNDSSKTSEVARTVALNTPLRNAIKLRRKSLASDMQVLEDLNYEFVSENPSGAELKKHMLTPIKKAIEARRKSIKTEAEELNAVEESLLITNPALESCVIKTPLRNRQAKQQSGRSVQKYDCIASETLEMRYDGEVQKSLDSPLRDAIRSRRKSLVEKVHTLDVMCSDSGPNGVEEKSVNTPSPASMESKQCDLQSPSQSFDSLAVGAAQQQDDKKLQITYKALKTPLRRAIQSRRQSIMDEVDAIDNIASINGFAQSPTASDEPNSTIIGDPLHARKALKTPLRMSIQAHRKSNETSRQKKSLKTPIRKAIQSRRKSLDDEESALCNLAQRCESVGHDSAVKSLSTPLLKAIQSRRKSIVNQIAALEAAVPDSNLEKYEESATETNEMEVGQDMECESVKDEPAKSLHTPLKKAIQSRRKSKMQQDTNLGSMEPDSNLEKYEESATERDEMEVGQDMECESVKDEPAKSLHTPLKKAIQSRRKSKMQQDTNLGSMEPDSNLEKYEESATERDEMEVGQDMECESVKDEPAKSLHTPLKKAIQSRRKSKMQQDTNLGSMEPDSNLEKYEESATETDEMEVGQDMECESVKDEPAKSLHTPLKKAIQSRRTSIMEQVDELSQLVATSAVDSIENTASTEMAEVHKLKTPLLKAIQSRRKSLVAEADALDSSTSDDEIEDNLSLADCLEENFYMSTTCARLSIASYASSVEMTMGIEKDEAVEIALDEYLTNPRAVYSPHRTSVSSSFRRRESLLSSLQKKGKSYEITADKVADIMSSLTEEDFDMIDEYSEKLAASASMDSHEAYALALDAYIQGIEASHRRFSLCTCTSTPKLSSVDPSKQRRKDMNLVSQYAEELAENACFSSDIAYGVALDTYLADPEEFRKHISKKEHNIQNLSDPTKCQLDMVVEAESAATPIVSSTRKSRVSSRKKAPATSVEDVVEEETAVVADNAVVEDSEGEVAEAESAATPIVTSTRKSRVSSRKKAPAASVEDVVEEETAVVADDAVVEDSEGEVAEAESAATPIVTSTRKSRVSSRKKAPAASVEDVVEEETAVVADDAVVEDSEGEVAEAESAATPIVSSTRKSRVSSRKKAPAASVEDVVEEETAVVADDAVVEDSEGEVAEAESAATPIVTSTRKSRVSSRKKAPAASVEDVVEEETAVVADNAVVEDSEGEVAEAESAATPIVTSTRKSRVSSRKKAPAASVEDVVDEETAVVADDAVVEDSEGEVAEAESAATPIVSSTRKSRVSSRKKAPAASVEDVVEEETAVVADDAVVEDSEGEVAEAESAATPIVTSTRKSRVSSRKKAPAASVEDVVEEETAVVADNAVVEDSEGEVAEAESAATPIVSSTRKSRVSSRKKAPAASVEDVVEEETAVVADNAVVEDSEGEVAEAESAATPIVTSTRKSRVSSRKKAPAASVEDVVDEETAVVADDAVVEDKVGEVVKVEYSNIQRSTRSRGGRKRTTSDDSVASDRCLSTAKRVRSSAKKSVTDDKVPTECAEISVTKKVSSRRGKGFVESVSQCKPNSRKRSASTNPTKRSTRRKVEVPNSVEEDSDDETALAILCDGCDGEYLVEDVGLEEIPEGDWFCDACTSKKAKSTRTSKRGKTSKASVAATIEDSSTQSTRRNLRKRK